jgi:hypothetical protein
MSNDIKDNIKQQSTWIRGLYMVLFSILYAIADFVFFAVVVFQFVLKLFSGNTNDRLRKLGLSISTYIYEILQFLSFNSEQHPYPFGTWPRGESRAAEPKVAEPKSEQAKPQEPSVPKEIKAVAKKAAPPKKAKKE